MKGNRNTASDLEIRLEEFTAELTKAAYAVALRHGARDKWLDLQLGPKAKGQRKPKGTLYTNATSENPLRKK